MITIGVDIGGSHITSAAVDLTNSEIIRASRNHIKVNNKGSVPEIMDTWAHAINQTMEPYQQSDIEGIGFAMPGPFDYVKGIALFEGNDKYESLRNVHIRETLGNHLIYTGLEMRYLNDATSFGVGVAWLGESRGVKRSIAITLGTGFGSAFIENGFPVLDREDVPKDGFFWNIPYKEGIADDYFSTRWFLSAYKAVAGNSVNGVKEMAEKARESSEIHKIFETFGENLGNFLYPWLRKFPVKMIVLGGNISKAYDLFGPALESSINIKGELPILKVSDLQEDAALIGSARLFQGSYWQQIRDLIST